MCNLTKRDSEKKDQTNYLVSNFSEIYFYMQDWGPQQRNHIAISIVIVIVLVTFIFVVIVLVTFIFVVIAIVIVIVVIFILILFLFVFIVVIVIVIIIYRIGDLSKEAILQAIKDKDLRFLQVRIRYVKCVTIC